MVISILSLFPIYPSRLSKNFPIYLLSKLFLINFLKTFLIVFSPSSVPFFPKKFFLKIKPELLYLKNMKYLPIGISTFRDIIEGNFLYIDKTEYIYQMIRPAKGYYFLSRPRRFGKSLLVSTLDEIFSGNKELFKGLWIYKSDWKWEKYPVIRLDMSKMKVNGEEELKIKLENLILQIAESFNIELRNKQFYDLMFDELIIKTAELTEKKKVVILIDEYDKLIIDNITNREEVIGIRDILKGFYGVMKAEDRYIRFIFMTGVSKFSKAGVFSELNNLIDITMIPQYATMLGITEEEMERYFAEHIEGMAKELKISKKRSDRENKRLV